MSDEDSNADVNLQRPIVNIANVVNSDGTQSKFSDLLTALSSGQILNGSVTNEKLADDAVTGDKIDDGTITEENLGTGCLHQVKATVTWNGGATQVIATLPANSLLMSAVSVCTETWDGKDASVSIGYTAGTGNIFNNGSVAVSGGEEAGDDASVSYGADTWVDGPPARPKFKFYAVQKVVNAYVTAGDGASAGSTDIYLFYVPTA